MSWKEKKREKKKEKHELSKKLNYLTATYLQTYHPNPYYPQPLRAPPWTSLRTALMYHMIPDSQLRYFQRIFWVRESSDGSLTL